MDKKIWMARLQKYNPENWQYDANIYREISLENIKKIFATCLTCGEKIDVCSKVLSVYQRQEIDCKPHKISCKNGCETWIFYVLPADMSIQTLFR